MYEGTCPKCGGETVDRKIWTRDGGIVLVECQQCGYEAQRPREVRPRAVPQDQTTLEVG